MRAFQNNAFQNNAFQNNFIVCTVSVTFPVNCVLMGEQVYDRTKTIFEPGSGKTSTRSVLIKAAGGRLSGDGPSFVTRNSKGYD